MIPFTCILCMKIHDKSTKGLCKKQNCAVRSVVSDKKSSGSVNKLLNLHHR